MTGWRVHPGHGRTLVSLSRHHVKLDAGQGVASRTEKGCCDGLTAREDPLRDGGPEERDAFGCVSVRCLAAAPDPLIAALDRHPVGC